MTLDKAETTPTLLKLEGGINAILDPIMDGGGGFIAYCFRVKHELKKLE